MPIVCPLPHIRRCCCSCPRSGWRVRNDAATIQSDGDGQYLRHPGCRDCSPVGDRSHCRRFVPLCQQTRYPQESSTVFSFTIVSSTFHSSVPWWTWWRQHLGHQTPPPSFAFWSFFLWAFGRKKFTKKNVNVSCCFVNEKPLGPRAECAVT